MKTSTALSAPARVVRSPGAMRRLLFQLAAAAGAALAAAPAPAADAKRTFQAGAARSNATPRLGTFINTDRPATHVHDDLYARCLVLSDGRTQIAFAMVDGCIIHQEVFDRAKQRVHELTGFPIDHILISSTHTHSAPDAIGRPQSNRDPEEQKSMVSRIVDSQKPDRDLEYHAFLSERIADGIIRAKNNLRPARIGWGRGSLPFYLHNRRWFMKPGTPVPNPFGTDDRVKMNPGAGNPNLVEPAGAVDPDINFLSVQSVDGHPIALLANYGLHYVGGVGGGDISADYFGVFAEKIGELLGADRGGLPFVGIMSNGTSGDVTSVNVKSPEQRHAPYEKMNRIANAVAAEVFRVHQQIEFKDWVSLDAVHRRIELGVRLPDSAELTRARGVIGRARGFPRMSTPQEVYAREAVLLSVFPPTVTMYLQALRIGDVVVGAIPCETFAETGLEIKARSPYPRAFAISLGNGYHGYMPPARHHDWGGYETWRARSSYLERDAAAKVTDTVTALFAELKAREAK